MFYLFQGRQYNITNPALIGLCFLPAGLGSLSQSLHVDISITVMLRSFLVGAPVAGRISDRIVVKYRDKRGGIWYPEDRLRSTLLGAGVLVPLSVIFSGLLTQFVPGRTSLVFNLFCLFLAGFGVCPFIHHAREAVDIIR
jgi:MFS family permease